MNNTKKEALEYYLDIRGRLERCNDLFCTIGIDLIGIAVIEDNSAPHYFTSAIERLSDFLNLLTGIDPYDDELFDTFHDYFRGKVNKKEIMERLHPYLE